MTTSQLSTTEPKKQKQTKQTIRTVTESQKWRSHGGYQWGDRGGRMREKLQGIISINGRYKIDRGRLRIVIGNGEAKELMCMTHGHELRWGNVGGRWGTGQRGIKGKKMGQL